MIAVRLISNIDRELVACAFRRNAARNAYRGCSTDAGRQANLNLINSESRRIDALLDERMTVLLGTFTVPDSPEGIELPPRPAAEPPQQGTSI